jgi:hypothetical protein
MTMKRMLVTLAACSTMSFALVASAQAAGTSVTGGVAAGPAAAAPAAKKAPKPVVYHLTVFNAEFEQTNEATLDLYNKTKTWSVEGYCDAGTFTKAGKDLTLSDECVGQTWFEEKVKHAKNTYFGPDFDEFDEFVAYIELVKV